MDKYIIDGGVPLRGEYRIRGAKNSVLPIMAATVCKAGVYELYDCPRIGDVFAMEEILQSLGAGTRWKEHFRKQNFKRNDAGNAFVCFSAWESAYKVR